MARRPNGQHVSLPVWFLIGLATLVAVAWFVINIGAFFLGRSVDVELHALMGSVVGLSFGGGVLIKWRRNDRS